MAFLLSPNVFAEDELPPEGGTKKLFRITGYYSPLPNQSKYVRGSYEADVRLNGRGTNGADGTEVYPGMLASSHNILIWNTNISSGIRVGNRSRSRRRNVSAGNRGQTHTTALMSGWEKEKKDSLRRSLWEAELSREFSIHSDQTFSSTFSWNTIPQSRSHSCQIFPPFPQQPILRLMLLRFKKALRELGFYDRTVNGILDESTTAAITDFQLAF